jgi:hypothetical protein
MLGQAEYWRELCDIVRPIGRYQEAIGWITVGDLLTRWRWTLDHHVARIYFRLAGQARAVRRIVEKTPGHSSWFQRIIKTFPNSKIIFVCRHPVDVYGSYRKRLSRDLEAGVDRLNLSWLEIDPLKFCSIYAKTVNRALSQKDTFKGRIEVFRYEDMTRDAVGTMQRVCRFLSEPYEPVMITETPMKVSRYRPEGTPAEPLLQEVVRQQETEWNKYVRYEEAKFIEDSLQAELVFLGYPRRTEQ